MTKTKNKVSIIAVYKTEKKLQWADEEFLSDYDCKLVEKNVLTDMI